MRKPTPVMIKRKSVESWSILNSKGTVNVSILKRVNQK